MKNLSGVIVGVFVGLSGLLLAQVPAVPSAPSAPLVYVIPIRDEIEPTMEYLVRLGVKEALDQKATALILHMETNGGRVDCTEKIIQALQNFKPQDQTYTLIDKKAISAGAFISAATRHIYMTTGSVIGAAAPVMAAPGQGPQLIPESYEEKITSAIRAMVRSNAEMNGHRPEVFDAMVDRNQGLKIGGKEIIPAGKLLTLTTNEAEQKIGGKTLLSSGTVTDLKALATQIAGPNVQIITLEATGFEKVARFITMISPFLLTAGMALGYLEFKTPGFGLFGISAALCFLVYFLGHYVAGLSGYEPVLIFFAGVSLLVVEIYLFPGLLIPSITGILLILFAFAFSKIDFYPGQSAFPQWNQFQTPLVQTTYSILGGFILMALLAKFIPSHWITQKLEEATVGGASVPVKSGLQVGSEGVSTTVLRPSGTAEFAGEFRDVVTTGVLIEAGCQIRVLSVDAFRVVVEPIQEEA